MIAKKNWKLNWYKPTKQRIYSKTAIISVYKGDKLKDTSNIATISPY